MEAGRNYCRMAMRTGLGSLRGFSCEVLEGLTGNSESAAFSTSTCWPTGCGNRLQGTKRLSLFILPFGGEGECLESGSRVHAQMSSETFQLRMEEVGSSPPRRCIFFFHKRCPNLLRLTTNHSPPTTGHFHLRHAPASAPCGWWRSPRALVCAVNILKLHGRQSALPGSSNRADLMFKPSTGTT